MFSLLMVLLIIVGLIMLAIVFVAVTANRPNSPIEWEEWMDEFVLKYDTDKLKDDDV